MYQKTEQEWDEIKTEILGEENLLHLKEIKLPTVDEENPEELEQMHDFTEEEKISLRRTIYLTIMNSIDYEDCIHKIVRMNVGVGHEIEVI